MKRYLDSELLQTICGFKELGGLFDPADHNLHLVAIQTAAMAEIERNLEEDEDLQKEGLIEAQETAGFHEIELRHAIGAHFNHLFLWSILDHPSKIKDAEPQGKFKEYVDKYFTDF